MGLQAPPCCGNLVGRELAVSSLQWGWVCFTHLGTYIPLHLSISSLLISSHLPLLLFPSLSPIGGLGDPRSSCFVRRSRGGSDANAMHHFVAFGGVSNSDRFDHDFEFHRNTIYWLPKIMEIIVCTFNIIEMYLQFFRSQS